MSLGKNLHHGQTYDTIFIATSYDTSLVIKFMTDDIYSRQGQLDTMLMLGQMTQCCNSRHNDCPTSLR